MSNPITRPNPAAWAVRAMPTMPPAGPDRMESLPRNDCALARPPWDCMNCTRTPGSSSGDAGYVTGQDRGEVGVHDRGVATGDQLHQRACRVGQRHLGEPRFRGDLADPGLVPGVAVAVQADDRGRAEPVIVGGLQAGGHGAGVQRDQHLAVRADALGGLDHPGVQHVRPDDLPVEDLRPVLVGDPQGVGEALGDDQDARLAVALKQGVRRHRGAQADHGDPFGRNALSRRDAKQVPDAGHRRVVVGTRVLRQQLVHGERAVRAAGHHVGERAAPVDPELPAPVHGTILRPPLVRARHPRVARHLCPS